jgi:hypothetical protein
MRFLDLVENPDPKSRSAAPLLLVFQTDGTTRLATVLLVPCRYTTSSENLGSLTPLIETPVGVLRAMVPEMAAVPRARFGAAIGSAIQHRDTLIRALDLLVTGV